MEKNKDLGAETETKEECKEKELIEKCELFKNINGEVVITSLGLARILKLRHTKIVQNIKNWIGEDLKKLSYVNNQNRQQYLYYELNKEQIEIYMTHCYRTPKEKRDYILRLFDFDLDKKYILRKEEGFGDKLKNTLKPLNIKVETQKTMFNGKYRIDFYLPEFNLAIEYDEEQHKYQQEEDKQREEEIKEVLGCKFIRLDYKQDDNYNIGLVLKEVFGR